MYSLGGYANRKLIKTEFIEQKNKFNTDSAFSTIHPLTLSVLLVVIISVEQCVPTGMSGEPTRVRGM